MLGSGIISKIRTAYTAIAATVSGLSRFKLLHRLSVIGALTSEIIISVIQSAATLNPATWVIQTGIVLFDINGRLIANISMLESGVPTWRAIQITVAIWGHLYVLKFAIQFFSRVAEETFAGDNAPKLPLYFFIAVFVLAPVQMVAGLASQGLQGQKIVISKQIIPYSGVYEVFTHANLWIEPIKQVLPDIGLLNSNAASALNSSKDVKVVK